MLSKSSKYAVKAVLYLALHSSEYKKIKAKEIAGPINVPGSYIAKLLQNLSRQQIISSTKGPNGGFYLNETNKKESIVTVINAIDGDLRLKSCLLCIDKCNEKKPCPLHQFASPFRTVLLNSFNTKSIAELADDVTAGKSFLPL